jgi:deoxyribodipyrimidine photolyase
VAGSSLLASADLSDDDGSDAGSEESDDGNDSDVRILTSVTPSKRNSAKQQQNSSPRDTSAARRRILSFIDPKTYGREKELDANDGTSNLNITLTAL